MSQDDRSVFHQFSLMVFGLPCRFSQLGRTFRATTFPPVWVGSILGSSRQVPAASRDYLFSKTRSRQAPLAWTMLTVARLYIEPPHILRAHEATGW